MPHTPGPWQLHRDGSTRACDGRHDSDEGCRTIVEAEILNVPRAEAEANARLIAAAPELLDACRLVAARAAALLNSGALAPNTVRAVQLAIAKAEAA